jgi:hypothetical protein
VFIIKYLTHTHYKHSTNMATDSVIKGKSINTDKVTFSAPNTLDNGAKLVYVNYNGGKFTVQTPWMDMPWQMSSFTEDKYPKHSITLSFRGMDDRPELQAFHDRLAALEDKIIDGGVTNSAPWFKKKTLSREVVDNMFGRMLRVSTDPDGTPNGKYPPSMKLKVPMRNGQWECKVYDKTGNQYRVNDKESGDEMQDLLVKNTKVKGLLQCVGLWIADRGYMCQWKLTRAELDVPETNATQSFLPDSDDEDMPETTSRSTSSAAGPASSNSSAPRMLDDSDEEEDDADGGEVEEEAEPEPAPTPAPKKKKVVRKAKN